MKKNVIILAAAVTLLSFAAGGCKAKEKISLDSIHTTESDSASMEKETMKESAAEATIETSSAQPSVSGTKETEGTTDSKDPASALSVRSKIATEKKGGISIEYPILSNLRDSSLTDKVNQLLKDNAVRIISGYDLDPDRYSVEISCYRITYFCLLLNYILKKQESSDFSLLLSFAIPKCRFLHN